MQSTALNKGFVRSSRTFDLVLSPAGTEQSIQAVPQAGVRFYIVESDNDAAVNIKTDSGVDELFTVGTGKEFSEENPFFRLQFQNLTADSITLRVFAGFGDYIDKRTTIVGNRLSSILPTIEPSTMPFPVAGGILTIAASTTLILPGTASGSQLRRKAVLVSNDDPATLLYVNDAAGDRICIVQPKTEIMLPISTACEVENPSGSIVSATVSEIWWMKP
jgi:hypothetical protein